MDNDHGPQGVVQADGVKQPEQRHQDDLWREEHAGYNQHEQPLAAPEGHLAEDVAEQSAERDREHGGRDRHQE